MNCGLFFISTGILHLYGSSPAYQILYLIVIYSIHILSTRVISPPALFFNTFVILEIIIRIFHFIFSLSFLYLYKYKGQIPPLRCHRSHKLIFYNLPYIITDKDFTLFCGGVFFPEVFLNIDHHLNLRYQTSFNRILYSTIVIL